MKIYLKISGIFNIRESHEKLLKTTQREPNSLSDWSIKNRLKRVEHRKTDGSSRHDAPEKRTLQHILQQKSKYMQIPLLLSVRNTKKKYINNCIIPDTVR